MTKSSKTNAAASPAATEDRDALFTAHQVHTLAQLTYQRLAQGATPWVGPDVGSQAAGRTMGGHPLPPTCFYWYA